MHGGTVSAIERRARHRQRIRRAISRRGASGGRRPAASPRIEGAGRLHVLVVDDNVDTAKGMAKLLMLSGHAVSIATSGIDAIEAARGECPEVVLLDIGLPGMDGYEVAKKFRQEICPNTRIIAISGYGDEEARRRTKEAGFYHHMVKPVDFDALISLLSQPRAAT